MTKKLQGELMSKDMEYERLDYENSQKQETIANFVLEREQLNQQISNNKGVYVKIQEYDEKIRTITELTDEKSQLEIDLLHLRYELRQSKETVKEAEATKEHVDKLKEALKHEYSDNLSQKLIALSDTLQKTRLEEYRATRKADEEERKVEYYSKLHKSMNEQVKALEEKVAFFEGEVVRKEEEFRKRDNDRVRLFGANRFEDIE